MKLHKMGKSNKEILEMLKIKGIKRRNKNDNNSVKDIIMCLNNLKKENKEEKLLNAN